MTAQAAQREIDTAYEEAKRLARDPDAGVRARVAARDDVRPEILYYLAEDSDSAVRRNVAVNAATPYQADLLLVRDPDETVRADLAGKLASVLPSLPAGRRDALLGHIEGMLDTLARDEAVRVRTVVAETLKAVSTVPHDLVTRLARDIEAAVASPVLRFSPLLTDADLIELVAHHKDNPALAAIAERDNVGEGVADAIVATGRSGAVAALLANKSAQIREETLDLIVDQAPAQPSWHAPLVARPVLPARAAKRISAFIADSLLRILEKRTDLDPAARAAVANAVRERAETAESKDGKEKEPAKGRGGDPDAVLAEVKRLAMAGQLDEEAVQEALLGGDRIFVRAALAEMAKVRIEIVDKILGARSPKGVIALAWKSGLGMRSAVQLQMRVGGIAPKQVVQPRNGTWPMAPEEMTWHLEFFGAT